MQDKPEHRPPIGRSLFEKHPARLVISHMVGADGVQHNDGVQDIMDRCASCDPLLRPKISDVLQALRAVEVIVSPDEVRCFPCDSRSLRRDCSCPPLISIGSINLFETVLYRMVLWCFLGRVSR